MLKIDFGMGVGIDAAGSNISASRRELGLAQIRDAAVTLFGGCTLTQTAGDWRDEETGNLFSEEGATLSVLTDADGLIIEDKILYVTEAIKQFLNQKAVYVTRYEVQAKLY